MADKKTNWTAQQLQAINTRDSDILVTASAGTGKTAVLSARCIDILKSDGCGVLDLLVLTFTELAAEEMRTRIAQQLSKAYIENGDKRLRTELMLLPAADISTIHSFCKRLVSEYFYMVDLDPSFGIVEPDQQELMKSEVLEKTVLWAWEQENLRSALELLLKGRDLRIDKGFLANIIYISQFLEGLISRDKWHQVIEKLFEGNQAQSPLADAQKQIIAGKLQTISQQLSFARSLCAKNGCDDKWLKKFDEKFVIPIGNLKDVFETQSWDDFSSAINQFSWPTRIAVKDIDPSAGDIYKNVIDSAKENFKDISGLAVLNPDYIRAIGPTANLQVKLIAQLVKKFDQLYCQAKRSINCLDFADLEHYALKILTVWQGDKLVPSAVAMGLREKYKHIFVDEYQDINPVQQAILDAVTKGKNIFVVGDIKQSIYAFRGAQPGIFLQRLNEAVDCKERIKIDLNANFRSRQNILQFVNTIFQKIMTDGCCGLNYDSRAALGAGTDEQKNSKPLPIELHILDEQAGENEPQNDEADQDELTISDDWNSLTPAKRQAAMIARRIKQMVCPDNGQAEFEIFDKALNKYRPIEYRDIVILMRSPAGKAEDYVEVLRLAGIPVSSQTAGGYFQATEIADCLSLLKVLDNRHRDIELAAILRSPFFKLTDTCLAKIKLCQTDNSKTGFYDLLQLYCRSGQNENLKNRLKGIVQQLDDWAMLAKGDSLSNLIWQIYRKTGYLSFVSALPGGQARRANLLKLHDLAIQFAKFNGQSTGSLTRFVEFVEKAQAADQNWSTAKPQNHAENTVRIMSVHSSKGLEFGVVFLAELNTKFNTKDSSSDLLVSAEDTIGLKIIDPDGKNKLSSIAHQVIAEKKAAMSLAEELRILYVALTRAKDKLILTASAKTGKCAEIISKGTYFNDKIADWAISDCKQPLEWILYGLCRQRQLQQAFNIQPNGKLEKDLIDVTIYNENDLAMLSNYLQQLKDRKSNDKKSSKVASDNHLIGKVKEILNWQYPFEGDTRIRAKDSVTRLAHRADEFAKIDYCDALALSPKAFNISSPTINFADSASIGTATHLLISNLNLKKKIDISQIDRVKQSLIAAGRLDESIAEYIDAAAIAGFFASDLGKKVLLAKHVWQEWQFTFGMDPDGRGDNKTNDLQIVVVQGVIDLLGETEEAFIVVDFKTDRVSPEQSTARAENYRRQLELYSNAVRSVFRIQKPVENWLYFLHCGLLVKI